MWSKPGRDTTANPPQAVVELTRCVVGSGPHGYSARKVAAGSMRTIRRAKDELQDDGIIITVTKERGKPDGKWFWKLETS